MKSDEIKALHDQDIQQLQKQLSQVQKELAKARLERAAGKLDDVNLPAKLGDDVARIKTILREKQLLIQAQQKLEKSNSNNEEEQ